MRWTILLAVAFGCVMSALVDGMSLAPVYDQLRPVVTMQGEIVARTPDSVTVHMWGSKNRECRYIGIQAFSHLAGGLRQDTNIERVDQHTNGRTKPAGVYDIGTWRIHPITGAQAASVYVQHDCDGRVVLTEVAEVSL